jgi:hypothetical protein
MAVTAATVGDGAIGTVEAPAPTVAEARVAIPGRAGVNRMVVIRAVRPVLAAAAKQLRPAIAMTGNNRLLTATSAVNDMKPDTTVKRESIRISRCLHQDIA